MTGRSFNLFSSMIAKKYAPPHALAARTFVNREQATTQENCVVA
jgi:hypothetical protein